jgi:hypothetical protein
MNTIMKIERPLPHTHTKGPSKRNVLYVQIHMHSCWIKEYIDSAWEHGVWSKYRFYLLHVNNPKKILISVRDSPKHQARFFSYGRRRSRQLVFSGIRKTRVAYRQLFVELKVSFTVFILYFVVIVNITNNLINPHAPNCYVNHFVRKAKKI